MHNAVIQTISVKSAYRALFNEVLPQQQIEEIRAYMQQQRALGNDRFQFAVERKLCRCASVRPAHRPAAQKPPEKALRLRYCGPFQPPFACIYVYECATPQLHREGGLYADLFAIG